MTGVFKVTEWIMRFSAVNLLWLATQFPIVLLILNTIFTENRSLPLVLLTVAIFAPFLFFPATAAMFATVRDWIIDREQPSIIKAFFRYYQKNYKVSLLTGTILTVLWVIVVIDFLYLHQSYPVLYFVFIAFSFVLYVYSLTVMVVLVHYDISILAILRKAVLFTFGSPVIFFITLGASFLILYVSINALPFLLLFFTGSLIAFITFSVFFRIYQKITNKPVTE